MNEQTNTSISIDPVGEKRHTSEFYTLSIRLVKNEGQIKVKEVKNFAR